MSDVGEADDPGGAGRPNTEPRLAISHAPRADRAAAVLALYALLVFKDRRRKRRHGDVTLPGV